LQILVGRVPPEYPFILVSYVLSGSPDVVLEESIALNPGIHFKDSTFSGKSVVFVKVGQVAKPSIKPLSSLLSVEAYPPR
jgi:hypothetical protein